MLRVIRLGSAPEAGSSDLRAIVATVAVSTFTSCSSVGSPATMTVTATFRAHMMGTTLGGALRSVRQVQWAAVSRCYARAGVNAHLGALKNYETPRIN